MSKNTFCKEPYDLKLHDSRASWSAIHNLILEFSPVWFGLVKKFLLDQHDDSWILDAHFRNLYVRNFTGYVVEKLLSEISHYRYSKLAK